MTAKITRSRTIKRRKTEKFRKENNESFWRPNELTPVMDLIADEEVEVTDPQSFKIFTEQEISQIGNYMKTADGLTMAEYGDDDQYVYVHKVNIKLHLIEKFNESSYACKVIGVKALDPDDPQMATEIVIAMDGDFITDQHIGLDAFFKNRQQAKGKNKPDAVPIFRSLLEALLDLRRRLPPIYNIGSKNFMVDPACGDAKIVLTDDMFRRDLDSGDASCKSPEELLDEGKSLTTPFWVIGCYLYEAQYGMHPFKTHLKPQVMEMFIKYYPVMFPEDAEEEPSESWKQLILQLLIKDPLQRLGSDSYEQEILDHAYFRGE